MPQAMNSAWRKRFSGAFPEIAGTLLVLVLWAAAYAMVPEGDDRGFVAAILLILLSPLILLGLYATAMIGAAVVWIIRAGFRSISPRQ